MVQLKQRLGTIVIELYNIRPYKLAIYTQYTRLLLLLHHYRVTPSSPITLEIAFYFCEQNAAAAPLLKQIIIGYARAHGVIIRRVFFLCFVSIDSTRARALARLCVRVWRWYARWTKHLIGLCTSTRCWIVRVSTDVVIIRWRTRELHYACFLQKALFHFCFYVHFASRIRSVASCWTRSVLFFLIVALVTSGDVLRRPFCDRWRGKRSGCKNRWSRNRAALVAAPCKRERENSREKRHRPRRTLDEWSRSVNQKRKGCFGLKSLNTALSCKHHLYT